ncbi:hypothetical protein BDP55DRAFT_685353 [Colletotrichum godetiae]|uniref:Uncharacterized protein n=1 Tax=Colletotrichum godetiae TaxID=1209918 RepID=A0AAJ0A6S8_9PEZI|nr:uncharacterized protein BDP55DRAFT_685353 [Colletotrichum godetiae]KAK1657538.1 hypothetical protein BDP55DRAFT_685353 [Colletotrichum godetiae]
MGIDPLVSTEDGLSTNSEILSSIMVGTERSSWVPLPNPSPLICSAIISDGYPSLIRDPSKSLLSLVDFSGHEQFCNWCCDRLISAESLYIAALLLMAIDSLLKTFRS